MTKTAPLLTAGNNKNTVVRSHLVFAGSSTSKSSDGVEAVTATVSLLKSTSGVLSRGVEGRRAGVAYVRCACNGDAMSMYSFGRGVRWRSSTKERGYPVLSGGSQEIEKTRLSNNRFARRCCWLSLLSALPPASEVLVRAGWPSETF